MIHAIGDSHINRLNHHEGVAVHHVGPGTAYNLIEPSSFGQQVLGIVRPLSPTDITVLSFGEIDCRVHIGKKHFETGQSKSVLIKATAVRYFQFVSTLPTAARVALLGVPPCGDQANIYNAPGYLPRNERALVLREFSDVMKGLCADSGMQYVDQNTHWGTPDGYIQDGEILDDVHLKDYTGQWAVDLIRNWKP